MLAECERLREIYKWQPPIPFERSGKMIVRLIGFRGSRREMYSNYGIVQCDEKNKGALIGKKVAWKSSAGKIISGKILRIHGSALLARFKKGLPGDAIGSVLEVGKITRPPEKKKPAKISKFTAAAKKAAPVKKVKTEAEKKAEKEEAPAKKPEKVKKEKPMKKAPAKKKPPAKTKKH